MAMGLSQSAAPDAAAADWSATRLLRSRSPGSVIAGPSCWLRFTWNGTGNCTCSTWNSEGRAASASSARHDHHGSGSLPERYTDSPRMDVSHSRRFKLGDQRGQLLERADAHESHQLRSRAEQPAAPADQSGEWCDRARGDHVDAPDRRDDGALLGPPTHDSPPPVLLPGSCQVGDHLVEELDAPRHRLDQGERHIGPGQPEWDAGQPRPAPDVD